MPSSQPNTNHRRKMDFFPFFRLAKKLTTNIAFGNRDMRIHAAYSYCLYSLLFFWNFSPVAFLLHFFFSPPNKIHIFQTFPTYHYHIYTLLHHFQEDSGNTQIKCSKQTNWIKIKRWFLFARSLSRHYFIIKPFSCNDAIYGKPRNSSTYSIERDIDTLMEFEVLLTRILSHSDFFSKIIWF